MTKRTLLISTLAALGAGTAYFRTVPMDADDWHADPMAGARTGKPNDFLIGPGGDRGAIVTEEAPADLAARIDRLALSEAGTERLAGSPEDGWTTYVQRSKVMGFPDAISVRVAPEGNGSTLAIWSRSRFGHSDMGVNRARVERWLAALGLP
ncbi:MAG: DUF1499 domain-containing protein [Jannaschia sp.]